MKFARKITEKIVGAKIKKKGSKKEQQGAKKMKISIEVAIIIRFHAKISHTHTHICSKQDMGADSDHFKTSELSVSRTKLQKGSELS